jgi:uncharacterized membrane protein YeaQ/YmgE (transglycosylase-associated protein family)
MQLIVLAEISSTVGWLGWIIIGAIAGALAGRVMRGAGFGLLGDILVGILGAIVGGLLLGLFVTADVGIIGSFITAFIGACILLFVARLFTGRRTTAY